MMRCNVAIPLSIGLAEQLDLKVWIPAKQKGLITAAAGGGCSVCRALLARCCTAQSEARLHVTDMAKLHPRNLIQPPSLGAKVKRILA